MKPFITVPKIHVARSVMNGFRRRAWKAFPNEYLELLWGWREHDDVYIVTSVHIEQTATPDWVEPESDELIELAWKEPQEHKLKYVGSIHTHPVLKKDPYYMTEVNLHLSRCDHEGSSQDGELVAAVMVPWVNVNGKKCSRVQWWVPQGVIKPIIT